jgi:UDP-glucose 4-epimerase
VKAAPDEHTAGLHAERLRGVRVLVTGGTGFIGGRLLAVLEAAGVTITAGTRAEAPPPTGGCTWVRANLASRDEVEALIDAARPEVVFHLAAVLGAERSLEFADRAVEGNFLATHHLLSVLGRTGGLKRLVVMGSSEEYGRKDVLPLTEEMPADPVSPYSASKAAATQFALLYSRLFDLPVTVLRPFIAYGPGQQPGMLVPSLMAELRAGRPFRMTVGEQTRDFVFVDDVVECMLAASVLDSAVGEVFNVCSGVERTIREVAELAAAVAGSPPGALQVGALPYRTNEVWRLVGSNEKARQRLGWVPRTQLEDGLRRTWEAYDR